MYCIDTRVVNYSQLDHPRWSPSQAGWKKNGYDRPAVGIIEAAIVQQQMSQISFIRKIHSCEIKNITKLKNRTIRL